MGWLTKWLPDLPRLQVPWDYVAAHSADPAWAAAPATGLGQVLRAGQYPLFTMNTDHWPGRVDGLFRDGHPVMLLHRVPWPRRKTLWDVLDLIADSGPDDLRYHDVVARTMEGRTLLAGRSQLAGEGKSATEASFAVVTGDGQPVMQVTEHWDDEAARDSARRGERLPTEQPEAYDGLTATARGRGIAQGITVTAHGRTHRLSRLHQERPRIWSDDGGEVLRLWYVAREGQIPSHLELRITRSPRSDAEAAAWLAALMHWWRRDTVI